MGGICHILNLINCSNNLLTLITGTMNVMARRIYDEELNFTFMCHTDDYFDIACSKILGPNCCLNSSAFDAYLDHGLPPTATKNLIHLCQSKYTNYKQHFYQVCDQVSFDFETFLSCAHFRLIIETMK